MRDQPREPEAGSFIDESIKIPQRRKVLNAVTQRDGRRGRSELQCSDKRLRGEGRWHIGSMALRRK